MNAPFDPEETHEGPEEAQDGPEGTETTETPDETPGETPGWSGETQDGFERDDPFGENSVTWGAADPDFDRMLRDRLGPLPSMPTPPYAFERALLAGRRRRARKVWAAGATAALVVMAGTAGTTVALRGAPSPSGVVAPAATGTQSTSAPATPSFSAPASPTPSATATPTPTATTASASPPASASASASATVAQCHSDDLQLTVTAQSGDTSGSTGTLLIVLRNNSPHACTMYGFPGLQTENTNEQLQNTTVKWGNGSAAKHLTVKPGAYVSTLATFTPVPAGATAPPAGCGAPSYYLAVIPPNEQTQLVATISGGPVTVCGDGVVNTGPMVPGTTGGQ